MSDYNPSTGTLSPLSYVHVSCIANDANSEGILLKCTCHIYNTIHCASLTGIDLSQGQDAVLDDSMTCMHCIVDTKVKNPISLVNNPVIVIGMASQNSRTKLSVIHDDTVAMININFNQSNSCFAKCQNGECTARLQNKKKIPKCRSIQQCENLCGHIQTLFANFEVLSELFPDYFVTSDGNSEANEDVCYGDSFA